MGKLLSIFRNKNWAAIKSKSNLYKWKNLHAKTNLFSAISFIFLTSCNGQTKTELQTDKQSETKTIPIGQPKLINTQGTQQNDNIHCGLQDKV